MAGNTFGQVFRVTTAGESHGLGHIAVIDGCPAGLSLKAEDFAFDLARRRPGQSDLTSPRKEPDTLEILSGVFEGQTTGSSIALWVRNRDARSRDYEALREVYRPGHADHAYQAKFGLRDHRGGGRASARETVSRVAAAVVAKKLLSTAGIEIIGYVVQVGDVVAQVDPTAVTVEDVEGDPTRCPDPAVAGVMGERIREVRAAGDSIGGVAEVVARGVPAGLGEPVFDKLRADLAKALFSLPAVMGVEFGRGFAAARSLGSEHNDAFVQREEAVETRTNRHGGMLGGISTGMPIVMRAAIKPTSSIPRPQETITTAGEVTEVRVTGRHDPCLAPRFVPMAEAMVALTLVDHWLRHRLSRL